MAVFMWHFRENGVPRINVLDSGKLLPHIPVRLNSLANADVLFTEQYKSSYSLTSVKNLYSLTYSFSYSFNPSGPLLIARIGYWILRGCKCFLVLKTLVLKVMYIDTCLVLELA